MKHNPDVSDARVTRLQRFAAKDDGDPEPLSVPVKDLLELVLAIRERDERLKLADELAEAAQLFLAYQGHQKEPEYWQSLLKAERAYR
jgi:hypothetical protein